MRCLTTAGWPPSYQCLPPVPLARRRNSHAPITHTLAPAPCLSAARVACVFVKFLEYSLAGMACGLIGQGVANSLMHTK